MTGERQSTGVTRREILFAAAGGVAAALAPAGSTPAFAQGATVSGVVFEDRDGSGARTPDAAGVANVLVSNGRDVAVTDAQGRYTLPLPDEGVIFVIKPAGYMPPVDPATQLPRFYRLHQPERLARLARPDLRRHRTDPRRCPPRSISRCAARRSPANSTSCCSPIRSPNRRRRSISSART